MILCNLSVLLAERNLTITKVSKDTGISRTTLTALSRNYGQGIQFDTLNGLCSYLKITPSDLLSFFSFDIKIRKCKIIEEDKEIEYTVEFRYNNKNYKYEFYGDLEIYYEERNLINGIDIFLKIPLYLNNDENFDEKERDAFIDAINTAPLRFLKEIESNLINETYSELERENYRINDEVSSDFSWGEFKK